MVEEPPAITRPRVSESTGNLVVMSRPTRSSNTLIGLVAVVLAAVSLTGCGPSYPDSQELRDFKANAAEFCGEGNYAEEDKSYRPLGGPNSFVYAVVCLTPPDAPADGYGAKWASISGEQLKEGPIGAWSSTEPYKEGVPSTSIRDLVELPPSEGTTAMELSRLGKGPILSISYSDPNSYS